MSDPFQHNMQISGTAAARLCVCVYLASLSLCVYFINSTVCVLSSHLPN